MGMNKSKLTIIALFLFIVVGAGYFAYDSYFQLEPQKEEEEEKILGYTEESLLFDKFNILILGTDGRAGVNSRTDTIMLASVDGKEKEAFLLSIPRDTRVKVKGGWDKVNAAYAYGGVELTLETVSDFLDVRIDRYVVVDFTSLVELVDEVGGIEVDVPLRMYVPLEGIDLQPGLQSLDGEQVLAYSRFRGTSEGDIGRAKRQQEVVSLLFAKLLSPSNITRAPQLIDIFQENVETDMTVKEMVALLRIAPAVQDKGIAAQVVPGQNKKIDGLWYWEPDLAELAGLLSASIAAVADSR